MFIVLIVGVIQHNGCCYLSCVKKLLYMSCIKTSVWGLLDTRYQTPPESQGLAKEDGGVLFVRAMGT